MSAQNRVRAAPAAQLADLPLFAGLERGTLARLERATRVISIPSHYVLFSAGQPIREIHCLLAGALKRYAQRAGDVEKVLELVSPGQMCALSESFASETYASFAETMAPSTLLAIDTATLKALAGSDITLCRRLLEVIASSHYACEFDVLQHRSLSVTQRVLDYLLSLAEPGRDLAGETTVRLAASKRIIAARLDMAPETLSRTLRQLSDDGLIVVDKRTVHIQNAPLAVTRPLGSQNDQSAIHYPRMERGAKPESISAAELINLCGRQRMLSQRLASDWALVQRDLAVQESQVALRKHRDQIRRNLQKLESLDLPEALVPQFAEITSVWQKFADGLNGTHADDDTPARIFELSECMLETVDRLTSSAASHAGTASAQLANVAGRNRMLCARMIKLFLFDDWGICRTEIARLKEQSRVEFQSNLDHLAATAGASPEVSAQLKIDAEHWALFLNHIEAAGTLNGTRTVELVRAGEELLRHADTTVKLCVQLAGRIDSGEFGSPVHP